MRYRIIVVLLMGTLYGFSQTSFTLDGRIGNLPATSVYLLSYYGERTSLFDSTTTDATGAFRFTLPGSLATGLYKLQWGKDQSIDLIFNKENIAFRTVAAHPADSLTILASVENTLYYTYMQIDRNNQMKLELLQPVVDYYPGKDPFYFRAVEEYDAVQQNQAEFLDSLQTAYPGSFAVSMFRLFQSPYLPPSLSGVTRLTYLKQHYFDRANFNDTALLRSNAWAVKSISFLSLFGNSKLSQKQLEAEFIKAVTVILSAAGQNQEVFSYLLDYLVTGFDRFHFEDVITYIAENFEDPHACENTDRKSALQKKLETFKKIAIGKPAPPLALPDISGKSFSLAEFRSEYTLLVFWSTECGHCLTMMPKLKALYDNQRTRRMEIVAVAIDTSQTAWKTTVETEGMNWINLSDLKGFDGEVADLYNIYATPTMFLLDSQKTILAKPISYRELEAVLREQGVK